MCEFECVRVKDEVLPLVTVQRIAGADAEQCNTEQSKQFSNSAEQCSTVRNIPHLCFSSYHKFIAMSLNQSINQSTYQPLTRKVNGLQLWGAAADSPHHVFFVIVDDMMKNVTVVKYTFKSGW